MFLLDLLLQSVEPYYDLECNLLELLVVYMMILLIVFVCSLDILKNKSLMYIVVLVVHTKQTSFSLVLNIIFALSHSCRHQKPFYL